MQLLHVSHSRTDRRPEALAQAEGIGMAVNDTLRDGKATREVRYSILSKALAARAFGGAARSHWAIENRCHWQLDGTLQEDQCRLRQGHDDANFSSLRRTALSLLKNHPSRCVGIKNKRLTAVWARPT